MIGQETGSIAAVNIAERKLVGRPGPIPSFRDAVAYDSATQGLYLVAFDNAIARTLVAMDTRSLATSSTRLDTIAARSTVGTLSVFGSLALAVTADPAASIVVDGRQAGSRGVVRLTRTTLTPAAFGGPFTPIPGGLVTGRSAAFPKGLLLLAGTRSTTAGSRQDYVFSLDPATLATVDSARFSGPTTGAASLIQIALAPGGTDLYVLTADSIIRFNLPSRQVTSARASGPPAPCVFRMTVRAYI